MASDAAQTHNGILNGEKPSNPLSSPVEECRSSQPHVTDPEDQDTQETTQAQDGSTKGTPHDNDGNSIDAALKHEEPRDPLESYKYQDDEASPDLSLADAGRTTQEAAPEREPSEDGNGERPVRRQLKKTSIAEAAQSQSLGADMASSQESSSEKADQASENSSVQGRGRERKRSFDDTEGENTLETAGSKVDKEEDGHRRKRSRDSKEEDETHSRKLDNNGMKDTQEDVVKYPGTESPVEGSGRRTPPEGPLDPIRSPTKKRSRDRFDADNSEAANKSDTAGDTDSKRAEGEPEKKRHRDNSQERAMESEHGVDSAKPSLPQPFSNTSSASPFTSFPASKPNAESGKGGHQKDQPKTSGPAFASSKLSAFAGSDKSPFGAVAGGDSIFKSSPAPSTDKKESIASSSAFTNSAFGAAAASPSAFGSMASGFGGGGNGFGGSGFGLSAAKSGGGLSSFAAPGGSSVLGGSSKSKTFGGSSDDEEEEEENEEEERTIGLGGDEKDGQDDRFYAQETETGEEGEEKCFSCRAKLFYFDKKEWKERGTGTFKINATKKKVENAQPDDGGESGEVKKTARMVMRTDRVLRVVLNAPLFKGMKIGSPTGGEPTEKQVNLVIVEDGKPVPLLLRTANVEMAKDLYHTSQDLLQQL